jgi:hypothetical protein
MFLTIFFSVIHSCQVMHALAPKHASYLDSDLSQLKGLHLAQFQNGTILIWLRLRSNELSCVRLHGLDVRLQ